MAQQDNQQGGKTQSPAQEKTGQNRDGQKSQQDFQTPSNVGSSQQADRTQSSQQKNK